MSTKDIRWEQRFSNYNKAFEKLLDVINRLDLSLDDEEINESISELEKEGMIQRFEYTHELAWKVMKDFLTFQGIASITGLRDATREAFQSNIIEDGETWMDMIKARNNTTRTYNEETARAVFLAIVRKYYPLFEAFRKKMENYRGGSQQDMFSQEL